MTPWRLPGPFEQTVEGLTKAPRDVHPHEVSSVGDDHDVRGRSDDLGGVCRGCDGHRTGSPMHENGRHLGTGKSVGQPGELGHSGLKRGTGRCGVDPEIGKLWRTVGGRKICGPEDPQRLHCFRFGSDASITRWSSMAARSTSSGGVRRTISASNAGKPPSPTPPKGSTTSAAATRS